MISFLVSAFAPIGASRHTPSQFQLPDLLLLPKPWDIGWPLYFVLCLCWSVAFAVVAFVVFYCALATLERIVPRSWLEFPVVIAAVILGAFAAGTYHGGLPR